MKNHKYIGLIIAIVITGWGGYYFGTRINWNTRYNTGDPLDELDGVTVYYNGGVNHTQGRNLAPDGYNLGIRYQCVEFVKRYYYEYYKHRMPDTYGHARSFFDPAVPHGTLNKQRGLYQYNNGNTEKPQKGDLLVWKAFIGNPYGHVAIISSVNDQSVEIVQQNPGPFKKSRATIKLEHNLREGKEVWSLKEKRIVGWLRYMPDEEKQ